MTNEEKASIIAKQHKLNYTIRYNVITYTESSEAECYNSAMDMAQWKDEQLESKLMQIIILAQQGYTRGATDEMILKQCKEVINENVEL